MIVLLFNGYHNEVIHASLYYIEGINSFKKSISISLGLWSLILIGWIFHNSNSTTKGYIIVIWVWNNEEVIQKHDSNI